MASSTPSRALASALGVTTLTAVMLVFAFRSASEGALHPFLALGATYAVLGAVAVVRARRVGNRAFLAPKAGDFTLGAVVALVLYFAGMGVTMVLLPEGSPRVAWIMRIYSIVGNPLDDTRHIIGAAVFLIAAAEELTWRGLVLPTLQSAFGTVRALALTTLLFGLAHLPIAFVLADPISGPNPLVPLAALGCGAIWGYLSVRTTRLPPALFAHALFTWAVVEFPLWRAF